MFDTSLTTLSFGGGQDSTAILLKLIYDKQFRAKMVPGDLVVVMSDTGNEHPETYRHTLKMLRLAKEHGVEMFVLTSSIARTALEMETTPEIAAELGVVEGYHSESWSDFVGHYDRTREIPGISLKKSCTHNLKILPLHRFLEQFVGRKYGIPAETKGPTGRLSGKKAIPEFARRYGRIVTMIGISKGEEKRAQSDDKGRAAYKIAIAKRIEEAERKGKKVPKTKKENKWEVDSIEIRYPLIEIGYDRKACQEYIKSVEPKTKIAVCPPSNCMFCPYLSTIELLWLKRNEPAKLEQWIAMEDAKLEKTAAAHAEANTELIAAGKKPKANHGVMKDVPLAEMVKRAEAKHGHMTNADLDEYKMSHGHCVASVY